MPTSTLARTTHSITLAETELRYVLARSTRARRLRFVIRPESGLEVVAPRTLGMSLIETAIREKQAWITRTLARFAARPSVAPPLLTTGTPLACAGAVRQLVAVHDSAATRTRISASGETIRIVSPRDDQQSLRAALEFWYRRQAAAIFPQRLTMYNAAYGYTYARVTIKDQKSRWGSCSHAGNLNFNWRLLLAPLPVLDYIVIHELCHLAEPNHSPRFWALVARACPEHREWRRWLRDHGQELQV